MNFYKVVYIGIGGIERCATIEAYTPWEARAEFEKSYWSYHEIVKVEEIQNELG